MKLDDSRAGYFQGNYEYCAADHPSQPHRHRTYRQLSAATITGHGIAA